MSFLKSINPYTNESINTYPLDTESGINQKLNELEKSFLLWRQKTLDERSQYLLRISAYLIEEKVNLARTASLEMGKLFKEALAEIEKSAWVCRHYAENTESYLEEQRIQTENSINKVIYEPLGIILAIMPWNFPYWQVFRCLAPNLMAGNLLLLKHASNVQGSANAIEKIVNRDFLLIKNIAIAGRDTEDLIKDSRVKAISLTGSETAGSSAASVAAKALKKSVLELGGSDPFIIHKDADLEKAVEGAFLSRMLNNGQSCIAAKRFIVHRDLYDSFIEKIREKIDAVKIGDPFAPDTDLGPLANEAAAKDLAAIVEESIAKGAKVIGEFKQEKAFFSPIILTGINRDCPAYYKELFGPVFSVYSYENIDDALAIANDTNYGLSASVWSASDDVIDFFSGNIRSGAVFVNDFSKSDPRLPFGGIKQSGYGRELSREGIMEFVNVKLISVRE